MIPSNWKVGDRVESPFGAPGRISKIDDAIHATFKEKGKKWRGVYDEMWFQLYDGTLKNFDADARALLNVKQIDLGGRLPR